MTQSQHRKNAAAVALARLGRGRSRRFTAAQIEAAKARLAKARKRRWAARQRWKGRDQ